MDKKLLEPPEVLPPRGSFAPSFASSERQLSQEQASTHLHKDVEQLGLQLQFDERGSEIKTVRCHLINSAGDRIESGLGKGIGLQCYLSAGFEALEHALSTEYSDMYRCATRVPLNSPNLLSRWNNPQIKDLPTKLPKDAEIPCLMFRNRFQETETVAVPQFLVDVGRASANSSSKLTIKPPPMGTNNGTAIGATFEEALLHALCELAERDAFAQFLLITFIKKRPTQVRLIDKNTLPEELQELFGKVEAETSHSVSIWDMTSDIGIPAYGAIIQTNDRLLTSLGCGASLDARYAIERALTEALQDYHMWNMEMEKENQNRLARLKPWPALKACAICAIDKLSEEKVLNTKFQESSVKTNPDIHSQLQCALNMLQSLNFTLLYAIHKELPSGTTCLRAIIPEFEAFHLVRAGVPILPGQRGREMLQQE